MSLRQSVTYYHGIYCISLLVYFNPSFSYIQGVSASYSNLHSNYSTHSRKFNINRYIQNRGYYTRI